MKNHDFYHLNQKYRNNPLARTIEQVLSNGFSHMNKSEVQRLDRCQFQLPWENPAAFSWSVRGHGLDLNFWLEGYLIFYVLAVALVKFSPRAVCEGEIIKGTRGGKASAMKNKRLQGKLQREVYLDFARAHIDDDKFQFSATWLWPPDHLRISTKTPHNLATLDNAHSCTSLEPQI